jgi:hypothetical protein
MTTVAKTLTVALRERLRWGLVIGLGLRGLGGLVQGGLVDCHGRTAWLGGQIRGPAIPATNTAKQG